MKVIVSYLTRVEEEIEIDEKWNKLVNICDKYPNFNKAPQEVIDYYNDNVDNFLEEIQKNYPYEICIDTANKNSICEMWKEW